MSGLKSVLEDICNAYFISGYESISEQCIISQLEGLTDDFRKDKVGSLIFEKEGCGPLKIMLIAHMDEVGLILKDVNKEGFVQFENLGGVDPITLIGQEVEILGGKRIFGVIGTSYVFDEELSKKAIEFKDLYIDTGYAKEDLEEWVRVGNPIGIRRDSMMLQNDNLVGHGLDDKAGVVVLFETAKELAKIGHHNTVLYACTAQEEVGIRGALTVAYKEQPDIVIAIDVGFGKTPELKPEECVELGKGPGIILGSTVNKALTKGIIGCADQYGVSIQHEIFPNYTGCDADAALVTGEGIPCIGISVPVRYMHTNIETVSIKDIKETGRMLAHYINGLKDESLEALLCY